MMLDWAASLFVVTIIVFGLVVVTEVFFATTDNNYVLRSGLSTTANVVAAQIDRLEGIPAGGGQGFYYNSSAGAGVPMPGALNGEVYDVSFTQDYVIVTSQGSGTLQGTDVPLTEPVHLYDEAQVVYLQTNPVTGLWLHEMDANESCATFPAGVNFQATVELITVDGVTEYQTFVYALDGMSYPC